MANPALYELESSTSKARTNDPRLTVSHSSKIAPTLARWADNELRLSIAKSQKQQLDQFLTKRQQDFELVYKTQPTLEKALKEDTSYKDSARKQKQYQAEAEQAERNRNVLASSLENQFLDIARNEIALSITKVDCTKEQQVQTKQITTILTRLDDLENKCRSVEGENQKLQDEVDKLKQKEAENIQDTTSREEHAKALSEVKNLLEQTNTRLQNTEKLVNERTDALNEAIAKVKGAAEVSLHSSMLELHTEFIKRELALDIKLKETAESAVALLMDSRFTAASNDQDPRLITGQISDRRNFGTPNAENANDVSGPAKEDTSVSILDSIRVETKERHAEIRPIHEAVIRLNTTTDVLQSRCQRLSEQSSSNESAIQRMKQDLHSFYQNLLHNQGGVSRNAQPSRAGASASPNNSLYPFSEPVLTPQIVPSQPPNYQGWQQPPMTVNTQIDPALIQTLDSMVRTHEHRLNNFTIGDIHRAILHQITQTYRYPEDVAREIQKFKAVAERVEGLEKTLDDIKSSSILRSDSQNEVLDMTDRPTSPRHHLRSLMENIGKLSELVDRQIKNLPVKLSNDRFASSSAMIKSSLLKADPITDHGLNLNCQLMEKLEFLALDVIGTHLTHLSKEQESHNRENSMNTTPTTAISERVALVESQIKTLSKYDHLLMHNEHNMLSVRIEGLDAKLQSAMPMKSELEALKKTIEKKDHFRTSVSEKPASHTTNRRPSQDVDELKSVVKYVEEQIEQFGNSLLDSKQAYDKRLSSLEQAATANTNPKAPSDVAACNEEFEYAVAKINEFVTELADLRGDMKVDQEKIIRLEHRVGIPPKAQAADRVDSPSARTSDTSHTVDSGRRGSKRKKQAYYSDSE